MIDFDTLKRLNDDELYQYIFANCSDPDAVMIMKMRWNQRIDTTELRSLRVEVKSLRDRHYSLKAELDQAVKDLRKARAELSSAVEVTEDVLEYLKEELQHEWERLLLMGRPSCRPKSLKNCDVQFSIRNASLLKQNARSTC